MKKTYKIQVTSLEDVDKTFQALFGFGFVFTTAHRVNNLEQVKQERSDMERGDWSWIVAGYDNDCQMVFGASRMFDLTTALYRETTLDEFLEINCCCPLAYKELNKEIDISTLPDGVEGTPNEYFKFTPMW